VCLSRAKTDEPIEIPLGGQANSDGTEEPSIRLELEFRIFPRGRGNFVGHIWVSYVCVSAFLIAHVWANFAMLGCLVFLHVEKVG